MTPSAFFLYKKWPAEIPSLRSEYYKHAQDGDGLSYKIEVWGVVDKNIRTNGYFIQWASLTRGPHALWPTFKPLVDVMYRYMTQIETGRERESNLNLSQFLAFRFESYLLENSYVLHRVFAISELI